MDGDPQRRDETAMLAEAARVWGLRGRRYGGLTNAIDAYLWRADGAVVAFVEAKRRPGVRWATYPTVYVAIRKVTALLMASLTGPVPLFLVGYDDGIGWWDVREGPYYPVRRVGRTDRPDHPNDLEPCIDLPVHALHPLSESPQWPAGL